MKRLIILAISTATAIVGTAILFSYVEHHSLWTSLYWAITEATTVGSPISANTSSGKVITTVLIFTAVPLMAAVFSTLTAQHAARRIHDKNKEHFDGMEQRLKDHISTEVQNAGQDTWAIDKET
jgi:ACR3 family arsenite efflux pump ArsB